MEYNFAGLLEKNYHSGKVKELTFKSYKTSKSFIEFLHLT